jgi:hypothetical protein
MPLTLDAQLQPSPDAIARELPGADGSPEGVILNIATHQYFSLNASGLRIWKIIEHREPLSAAVQDLMSGFDVEPERAEAAVLRLADELSAAELVKPVDDAA